MLGQDRDIARALAQRRQLKINDVKPEIEVLAETALADLVIHVAVRGGQETDIDLDRLSSADAVDLPLLNGAEQLGLQPRVHLGDLVQQQGPTARFLEASDAAGDGAGKGAFLMAEEFTLQEVLRDRGTVDGDEGLGGALGMTMDETRHDLLAGTRLAGDQHAGVGPGDLLGQSQHPAHGRIAEDEGTGLFRHRLQHGGDQLGVGRQRDVLLGAGANGLRRLLWVGVDAATDDLHGDALRIELLDEARDVELDVDHQQIGALATAQGRHRALDVVDVRDLGAAIESDLACRGDMAV